MRITFARKRLALCAAFVVMLAAAGTQVRAGSRVEFCKSPSCNSDPSKADGVSPLKSRLDKRRKVLGASGALSGGDGGPRAESPERVRLSLLLSLSALVAAAIGAAYSVRSLLLRLKGAVGRAAPRRAFAWRGALACATIAALAAAMLAPFVLTARTSASGGKSSGARAKSSKQTKPAGPAKSPGPSPKAIDTTGVGFTSAFKIGGTGTTQIGGLRADSQGNIYVTGGFTGQITFATSPQTVFNSTQDYDFFIAKFDSAGQPLWARVANGATGLPAGLSLDGGLALAIDSQGAAYVGGGFVSSLSFKDANGSVTTTLTDNNGDPDLEMFVAKYDASGTLAWARGGNSGTPADSDPTSLAAGINGITAITVGGGDTPFVAGTAAGTNFLGAPITNAGSNDVLLAALDPLTGTPAWVRTVGSSGDDNALGVATDSLSNVYVIGDMEGDITFPTLPTATTLTVPQGEVDTFFAKYDAAGQVLWAKEIGGSQPIQGTKIAANAAGDVYLTGLHDGTATFDGITVPDTADVNGFLAKYTTGGALQWVRSFGATSNPGGATGEGVELDSAGNAYVVGLFSGTINLGDQPGDATGSLTSDGREDQLVLKYGASGHLLNFKQLDGAGIESEDLIDSSSVPVSLSLINVASDPADGSLLVSGDFSGTLTLDSVTLTTGLTDHDGFVAKLANVASAHELLISEFRFQGATATDEFVELYNNTDSPINLNGYSVVIGGTSVPLGNASLPARDHYLLANSTGYSLTNYGGTGAAVPDQDYSGTVADAPPDASVSVLNSAAQVLDKVGFTTSPTGSCEGTCLTPTSATGQYSFVRKLTTGLPQDTDDNASDFQLVATDPAAVSGSALGAPGPENAASPVNRGSQIKATLLDPTASSSSSPNRDRDATAGNCGAATPAGNCAAGTLTVRRTFTNNTGQTITKLRFRVVDITTLDSPGYTPGGTRADVRLLSATGGTVSTSQGNKTVVDMTLDTPPTQSNGGGLNSSITATIGGGIAPGNSINVQFVLGVAQTGSFRFFVIVEATS